MRNRARHSMTLAPALFAIGALACAGSAGQVAEAPPAGRFDSLLTAAYAQGWDSLAIGGRVAAFALALEGTPYVEKTLEGPGPEVCRIPADGFDCVTFMEASLNLARIAVPRPAGAAPPDAGDLRAAVTETRYRNGVLDGYVSRLHYTSEWILDNQARGILREVSAELGGEPLALKLDFMSTHPDAYPALKDHPERVERMAAIEREVNAHEIAYIPKARIAEAEAGLRTGDLIAVATSIQGLDYTHTGLIWRDPDGVARFVHASSVAGRVVIGPALHEYVNAGPKHFIGVTVARPLEPAR